MLRIEFQTRKLLSRRLAGDSIWWWFHFSLLINVCIRYLLIFLSWKHRSEATTSDVSSCGKELETEKWAPEPHHLVSQGKKKVIKIRNCSLYSWPEKPTACDGFPLCCQDENHYHTSLDETQTTE